MRKVMFVLFLSLFITACSEPPEFIGYKLGTALNSVDDSFDCQKVKSSIACTKGVTNKGYYARHVLLYNDKKLSNIVVEFHNGDSANCKMVKDAFVLRAGEVVSTDIDAYGAKYITDSLIVSFTEIGDFCHVGVQTKESRLKELEKKTGV